MNVWMKIYFTDILIFRKAEKKRKLDDTPLEKPGDKHKTHKKHKQKKHWYDLVDTGECVWLWKKCYP